MVRIVSTVPHHTPLCEALLDHLDAEIIECFSGMFPAGEHSINFANSCPENLVSETVIVLMEFEEDCIIDRVLMQTLFYCAELKKRNARILLVAPFFPYGRQDRDIRDSVEDGYTAPCLLEHIGKLFSSVIRGLVTVAPHSESFASFFPGVAMRVISLAEAVLPMLRHQFEDARWSDITIVAADEGALSAAKQIAGCLGATSAHVKKQRTGVGKSKVLSVKGSLKKCCILIDDMVDSGNTLVSAAKALHDLGVHNIYAVVVHPVSLLKDEVDLDHMQRSLEGSMIGQLVHGPYIQGPFISLRSRGRFRVAPVALSLAQVIKDILKV